MGARGFNVAQEGHVVAVLNPGSITGGVAGQIFSLKNASECNLIIQWGALAAAPGAVTLSGCTDLAGDGAVPFAFSRYQQVASGAGNDVLAAREWVTADGYVPSDVPDTVDVLFFQADQLPAGCAYIKLNIADGADADYASAVAVLTGVRYQGESNQTATV